MASLPCPACRSAARRVVRRLALPHDARSDEVRVDVEVCDACGADGAVVTEASGRGAADAVDRRDVALPPEALDRLDDAIAACPAPDDPACGCATHVGLSVADGRGRWLGLAALLGAAWRRTADPERPYVADVGPTRLALRLGDFPAAPLYALEVDGVDVGSFEDWPVAWPRP